MAIFDIPLENLRRRRSIKWARFAPDVLPARLGRWAGA